MQQVSHVGAHPDLQDVQKLFVERDDEEKYRSLQLVSRSDGDSVQVCVPATITSIQIKLFFGNVWKKNINETFHQQKKWMN